MTTAPTPFPTVAGPAEVVLACADLAPTLAFFTGELGFRVETIFPADDPVTAVISGHGLRLRLEPGDGGAGAIRLPCPVPPARDERVRVAPNGTHVEWVLADPLVFLIALVIVKMRPGGFWAVARA